ncbi:hypothetical protein CLV43_10388 [Umezawaea tangerina]|uniref:Uncharacterized protein n=1 Tax=Umezawaea tangerina TaxID=84725 RepID=A0A2T0TCG2_9PSEU|nr:hypothetical protein CLV43_10388 [Umezawaea tangerina]
MRSTGSLLVRALTIGGLAAAAWLVGGAVASADTVDHGVGDTRAVDIVHSVLAEHRVSVEDTQVDVTGISEQWTTAMAAAPVDLGFLEPADEPEQDAEPEETTPAEDDSSTEELSFSGGIISNATERSGTISNAMPAELYAAKVEAKVAAKLAAQPAPDPVVEAPAPVVAEAEVVVAPVAVQQWTIPAIHVSAPVVDVEPAAPSSGPEWETPRPAAPAPAPQPASAPTAPTASSSGHDTSGGARGGASAVTTAQAAPRAPSTWTVERRDEARTPGSVQGLPSSSPD